MTLTPKKWDSNISGTFFVATNREPLEQPISHAVTQKIIPQTVAVEDLFAKNLLEVVG